MTSAPLPKRRLRQLHLSTAVVLMVTAGGFLGMNVLLHPSWPVNGNEQQRKCMRGWPCAAYSLISDDLAETDNGFAGMYFESEPHFRFAGTAFNAVALLAGLTGIAFVSEAILRRREARKP
jgi:hypothetical protein